MVYTSQSLRPTTPPTPTGHHPTPILHKLNFFFKPIYPPSHSYTFKNLTPTYTISSNPTLVIKAHHSLSPPIWHNCTSYALNTTSTLNTPSLHPPPSLQDTNQKMQKTHKNTYKDRNLIHICILNWLDEISFTLSGLMYPSYLTSNITFLTPMRHLSLICKGRSYKKKTQLQYPDSQRTLHL